MKVEDKIEKILHKKGFLNLDKNFNWKKHSWAVAQYCPEHLDPSKYNWEQHSYYVAQFCPDIIDPKLYNWEQHSYYVAEFCPEYLDPKNYNWETDSYYVAQLCPDKIDPKLYNWTKDSTTLIFYHPTHKYLKHCIWNKKTIENLQTLINYKTSVWKKYSTQLDDLLNTTKRKLLLEKISKDIKITRI